MSTGPGHTVLLINPCYDQGDALGPFAGYITAQLPLSVGFVAGYLLAKGIAVEIIDEQLRPAEERSLAQALERGAVAVVGISVLTLTSGRAYALGRMIKRQWPSVVVVMGGVHVTLLPEEAIEQGAADIVVRGEGELTFHELVVRLHSGTGWNDVAGISYRRSGGIQHNPDRPLIDDLDALPPFPYQLFRDAVDRYQFGNILASRGCPYDCIFCSQRAVSGRRYRVRSAGSILADIDTLVGTYGQDFIFINDDNFLVNAGLVHELCDGIIERNYPAALQIGFNGRGDSLSDEGLLRHLRRAHFKFVLIGFETGSERLMRMIKKGETVGQVAAGARLAKSSGFIIGGQFIIGFPTETRRESWRSICLALRLPIDFVRFNLLVPYPGTEVYEIARQESGEVGCDWSRFATHGGLTGGRAPYIPAGRTQRELVALQWIGHLLFYLRPKQLLGLRNLQYATGGQVRIPRIDSFRGFVGFLVFGLRLVRHLVRRLCARKAIPDRP